LELDRVERVVISALHAAGATDGLIGRRASTGVKTLPSTIYASALHRYGIDHGAGMAVVPDDPEAAELTELRMGRWQATLPGPPAGFPEAIDTRLDLTAREATWLRERITTSTAGSTSRSCPGPPRSGSASVIPTRYGPGVRRSTGRARETIRRVPPPRRRI
jgi:hypothetical protein